jgi:hypothetical protein
MGTLIQYVDLMLVFIDPHPKICKLGNIGTHCSSMNILFKYEISNSGMEDIVVHIHRGGYRASSARYGSDRYGSLL